MESRGRKKIRHNRERKEEPPRPFIYKGTFGVGRNYDQKQAQDAFTSKMTFGVERNYDQKQAEETVEDKPEVNRDGIKQR